MKKINKQKLKLSNKKPRGMKQIYAFGEKRKLDLSLSENPLGCSPLIISAIKNMTVKLNDYPHVNGKRIKEALSKELEISEEMFFVSSGSEVIINMIPRVLFKEGDEVIIPKLTFPMIKISCQLAGMKVQLAKMKDDLAIDLEEILNLISSKTKLVVVCNPNNPTGNVIGKDDLINFIDKVPSSTLVIVDEANIEFGGQSIVDEVKKRNNLIVLRTFSKGFGLANLRIGFAVAPVKVIERLEEELNVFPVSGLSESLAIEALQDKLFLDKTKEFVQKEREFLSNELEKLGFKVFPSMANNLFVKLPNKIGKELFLEELEKESISVVKGSSFPGFGDSFFRVSPRTQRVNREFVRKLRRVIKKLK